MNLRSIFSLRNKGYFNFSGKSFVDIVNRAMLLMRTRSKVAKVLKTIDLQAMKKIRERHTQRTEEGSPLKYFDVEKWVWDRLCDAYRLNIHKRKKSVILDIGTGFGYFPLICEFFGHKAYAIDMDNDSMFNDVVKLLKVNRTAQKVERLKPLPSMGLRFDIITGYMVCFNGLWDDKCWDTEEWDFFLKDLANNHCKENSEMLFLLNPEPDGRYYSDTLYQYFVNAGAHVRNNEVYFPSISKLLV